MKIILDEPAFVKRIIKKDSGDCKNPESFFHAARRAHETGIQPCIQLYRDTPSAVLNFRALF